MISIKKFFRNPALLLLLLVAAACEDDSAREVVLFEPGTVEATADKTSIKAGETVTFTDNSTKVQSRAWRFQGGTPETSGEKEVTVTFPRGGSYQAKLDVTFVDNQQQSTELMIEVEGLPEPIVPTFALYTENAGIDPGIGVVPQPNHQFVISEIAANTYEGSKALSFTIDGSSDWAMGSLKPEGGPVDISEFRDGFYKLALRSTSDGTILIRLQSSGQNAIVKLEAAAESYGFKRDGQWHMITIPIADFLADKPALNLEAITDLLVFRSEGDVRTATNYDFYLDNFHLSK